MEIAKSTKPLLAKQKVKFLMLRYRNCGERLTITGNANEKSGGKSNLPWDWFINFVVLGCLGLMSWERLNQILTPVISVFSIVSLFLIYFFRVNKWNISGPIFKLNALQELRQWRKIFKRENCFQMDETEPWEGGANRTLTANFVDCLSCGVIPPFLMGSACRTTQPFSVS